MRLAVAALLLVSCGSEVPGHPDFPFGGQNYELINQNPTAPGECATTFPADYMGATDLSDGRVTLARLTEDGTGLIPLARWSVDVDADGVTLGAMEPAEFDAGEVTNTYTIGGGRLEREVFTNNTGDHVSYKGTIPFTRNGVQCEAKLTATPCGNIYATCPLH